MANNKASDYIEGKRVLTYLLAPEDLGEIRFAVSPALEATLSLRALRDPARFPLQLPWVRKVQNRQAGLDWEVLSCLMNDRMGSPDFLTPPLSGPLATYAADLEIIGRTDPAEVERQLVAINGHLPDALAGPGALDRIIAAMEQYWQIMLEPYWPRMRTILEADVAYRGRIITQDGTAAMLNNLAPTIGYSHGRLRADQVSNPSREEAVAGRGLILFPTMFGPGAVIPFDIGHHPELGYPARGQGALWAMRARPDTSDLGRLIGHERLRILALLRSGPRSTSDLAIELAVTPSAVNQHLQLLRRTGLVDSYRVGKQVLYQPSDLTTMLIGA
ncbi:MAG TPA: ArsR family transcriptional regulator [Streptosporangiaceae bacterium]|nr:ArsR family transcriptional regulator [Streptosporangiaceae bacterium]